MIEKIEERFKKGLKSAHLTYEKLEKKINYLSLSQIKALGVGKKVLTPDIALDIEKETGISAAWILLGKGEMFDKQPSPLATAMGDTSTSRIQVPYYENIRASAGNGYVNDDDSSVEMISLPKAMIDKKVDPTKIDAIKVHGESMAPTINDADIVFVCKKVQDIVDGKIYVLKHNDEILVKRLFKRRETVLIKSDNPIFPQEELNKENIVVIGRVIYNLASL
jgi:phage repressor protein C with HTH and peptisase S24 domain